MRRLCRGAIEGVKLGNRFVMQGKGGPVTVSTACLTPLGIAEVLDRLVRRAGIDEEEAWLDLVQLGLAASPAAR